jgi:pyruvate/2-oxoglutarate/acetoin dehydrogenase E1 component
LNGIRSVMTHQRMDFFLLAMDQLVNNAAKWRYMFGGNGNVPIVIRLILGQGWGQGPTHSQNLHSWLAHIPGLKVVMPCFPSEAYQLLREAIIDPDPVVFLEHRWLHQLTESNPLEKEPQIGRAEVVREGSDLTIVASSYMVIESLRAADWLAENGASCEIINNHSIRPMDWQTIERSVSSTGRVLILDTGNPVCSIASEIAATITEQCWAQLKLPPRRLTLPDAPSPTSFGLTKDYYPGANHITQIVLEMCQGTQTYAGDLKALERCPHDVPGDWFKGPF